MRKDGNGNESGFGYSTIRQYEQPIGKGDGECRRRTECYGTACGDDSLINKTVESGIFDENVKWCKKKLDALETMGIYDRQTNSIHVENVNELTQEERNAIMVVTTGNLDIYSFAAENQFHADKYGKYLGIWNGNAIVSDAGVVESETTKYFNYESLFKSRNGKYYIDQVQFHGL